MEYPPKTAPTYGFALYPATTATPAQSYLQIRLNLLNLWTVIKRNEKSPVARPRSPPVKTQPQRLTTGPGSCAEIATANVWYDLTISSCTINFGFNDARSMFPGGGSAHVFQHPAGILCCRGRSTRSHTLALAGSLHCIHMCNSTWPVSECRTENELLNFGARFPTWWWLFAGF